MERTPAAPSVSTPSQLPKTYQPAETEPRIRQLWDTAVVDGSTQENGGGAFHADPSRVLSGERPAYSMVIPPPNVTGALHLGHALNNTIQDILARAHRMMGYETLWMPGTDHAGIATQAVVERRLRKEGKLKGALKEAMTREQFVEQVQVWKDEYEARITNQLKMMGASCDYARQRFTMDPICARAVREAFFRLFKDGLIYRGKRLVNWDPALQTAVADDECEDIEVDAAFYYLRYPLVRAETDASGCAVKEPDPQPVTWSELVVRGYPGAEGHPGDQPAWVTVATTRPETYLGDVAVAMNPRDPRARALEDLWVELPLVGRLLPIVKDEYVVLPKSLTREDEEAKDPKAEFATGFLKVTPAHDQNDYDLYQRNKEAIDRNSAGTGLINVMAPDASISDKHGWGDIGDGHIFIGKSREEARKLVVQEFYARGYQEETRPYRHTVKHSDRSKAAIEPYLSDQWFVRVTDPRMAGAANEGLDPAQRSGQGTRRGPGLRPGVGASGSSDGATGSEQSGPEARSTAPLASPSATAGGITTTRGPGLRPGVGASGSSEGATGGELSGPEARSTAPFASSAGVASRPSHTGTPKWATPITAELNRSRRFLPHWERGGSTYFLTFRVRQGVMSEPERQVVLDACRHWHGTRIDLYLVTVMPDHVHLILTPKEKSPGVWWSLSELLHSIKSFSSHEIQKLRGASGPFWQDEHFDHLLRDIDEFEQKWNYMVNNPVKAGLAQRPQDYPFTFVAEGEPSGLVAESTATRGPGLRPGVGASGSREGATGSAQSGPEARSTAPFASPGTSGDDSFNHLRFFPARYAKTYEQWHDNIRDWCISRQLWWGHRIPVWKISPELPNSQGNIPDFVTQPEEYLAELQKQLDDFGREVGFPNSFFAQRGGWDASTLAHYICIRTDAASDIWRLAVGHLNQTAISYTPGTRIPEGPEPMPTAEAMVATLKLGAFISKVHPQDPDVLDTWFSSALWPLSTMGWPDPEQSPEMKGLLEAFNPTSVLSTAREIITLWVSRMVMFNQYFLAEAPGTGHQASAGKAKASPDARCPVPDACSRGPVPFREVFIHAVVQDGDGKKMSKTLGNGVDPLDIIESHGADAMRFTLCHMTTQTQDVRMPVVKDSKTGKNTSPKFDLGRNFCNKLWNATRFALGMLSDGATERRSGEGGETAKRPSLHLADRWMLSRLHTAVRDANAALASYDFAGYAQTLYDILWRDFCDWYLEAIKSTAAESAPQRAVLAHALETIVRLLHPVTPFVTEAIWEHLRGVETAPVAGFNLAPSRISGLLCGAGWPVLDDSLRDETAEREFERVRGVVSAIREVRSQHNVLPKRRITLHAPAALIDALTSSGGLAYVQSLAGVERVTTDSPASNVGTATLTHDAMELTLSNLADAMDASAEKERLSKELSDKKKSAETIQKRLENPGYVAKAPPKLVEESKAQLEMLRTEIVSIEERLGAVG